MNFVDDVNSVSCVNGSEVGFFNNIADVVNTVVAGGVKLNNVKNGSVVNSAADLTFVARVAVNRVKTVDRFGKNFGAGGFTCSSGTREQICVRNLARNNFIGKGRGYMLLPCNVCKATWPPFSVKHLIQKITLKIKIGIKNEALPLSYGMQAGCGAQC